MSRLKYYIFICICLTGAQAFGQGIVSPPSNISCGSSIFSEPFNAGIPSGWTAGQKGFGTDLNGGTDEITLTIITKTDFEKYY
jgi:hypothetical protein